MADPTASDRVYPNGSPITSTHGRGVRHAIGRKCFRDRSDQCSPAPTKIARPSDRKSGAGPYQCSAGRLSSGDRLLSRRCGGRRRGGERAGHGCGNGGRAAGDVVGASLAPSFHPVRASAADNRGAAVRSAGWAGGSPIRPDRTLGMLAEGARRVRSGILRGPSPRRPHGAAGVTFPLQGPGGRVESVIFRWLGACWRRLGCGLVPAWGPELRGLRLVRGGVWGWFRPGAGTSRFRGRAGGVGLVPAWGRNFAV